MVEKTIHEWCLMGWKRFYSVDFTPGSFKRLWGTRANSCTPSVFRSPQPLRRETTIMRKYLLSAPGCNSGSISVQSCVCMFKKIIEELPKLLCSHVVSVITTADSDVWMLNGCLGKHKAAELWLLDDPYLETHPLSSSLDISGWQ